MSRTGAVVGGRWTYEAAGHWGYENPAPVILGGGKRLFDAFSQSLELEHLGVRQSPFATFVDYRVKR
jgi:hypothetical protein